MTARHFLAAHLDVYAYDLGEAARVTIRHLLAEDPDAARRWIQAFRERVHRFDLTATQLLQLIDQPGPTPEQIAVLDGAKESADAPE